jgi:hypothetical protein
LSPRRFGGDVACQPGYEAAASLAHDRCLIGHTLAPEVSSVHVQGDLRWRQPPTRPAARQTASGVPTRIVDAVRRLDGQDQFGIDELMRLLATPPT